MMEKLGMVVKYSELQNAIMLQESLKIWEEVWPCHAYPDDFVCTCMAVYPFCQHADSDLISPRVPCCRISEKSHLMLNVPASIFAFVLPSSFNFGLVLESYSLFKYVVLMYVGWCVIGNVFFMYV